MILIRKIFELFDRELKLRIWEDDLSEELMFRIPNWEAVYDEEGRNDLDENAIRPSLDQKNIGDSTIYTLIEIRRLEKTEYGMARVYKGEVEFFANFKDDDRKLVCINSNGKWIIKMKINNELNDVTINDAIIANSILPYNHRKIIVKIN